MTTRLKTLDEGKAIILAQTLIPLLLLELDQADAAVSASRVDIERIETEQLAGPGPVRPSTDSLVTAHRRHDENLGYRSGIRHALARIAGILGYTGINWLADLRAFTER